MMPTLKTLKKNETTKAEIIETLEDQGVECSERMTKDELWELLVTSVTEDEPTEEELKQVEEEFEEELDETQTEALNLILKQQATILDMMKKVAQAVNKLVVKNKSGRF